MVYVMYTYNVCHRRQPTKWSPIVPTSWYLYSSFSPKCELNLMTHFYGIEYGKSDRISLLRLGYKRTVLLTLSLSLKRTASSLIINCPVERPMWNGKKLRPSHQQPTDTEACQHHVSEFRSRSTFQMTWTQAENLIIIHEGPWAGGTQ